MLSEQILSSGTPNSIMREMLDPRLSSAEEEADRLSAGITSGTPDSVRREMGSRLGPIFPLYISTAVRTASGKMKISVPEPIRSGTMYISAEAGLKRVLPRMNWYTPFSRGLCAETARRKARRIVKKQSKIETVINQGDAMKTDRTADGGKTGFLCRLL